MLSVILSHFKLKLWRNEVDQKNKSSKQGLICWEALMMRRKFANCWVEYKDPIDLIHCPSNIEIGFS